MHLLKANIFFHKDLDQAAISEYAHAAFLSRTHGFPLLNEIHATMGAILYKRGQYRKALSYYRMIDTCYPMQVNARSALYSNMAACYNYINRFDSAEFYYQKSINLQPDTSRLMVAYLNIGSLYFDYNDNRAAAHYWQKSMELALSQKNNRILEHLYYNFFMLSEDRKDYMRALSYYKASDSLRTLLKDREQLWELGQAEKKLAVQARQLKISELQNESYKQRIALAQQRSQRNRLIGIALGLMLITGVAGFFLIQRNRSARVIRQKNHQLEALNKTKDRLFSIIAHDLRAPVNALQQKNLKALQSMKQGDHLAASDLIVHIHKDTEQASLLLNNLLHWSFSETGNLLLISQPLLLKACVEQICQELSFACREKNIAIDLHIPDQLIVRTDLASLRIILRNLIQNAVKFSYLNQKIEIRSQTDQMGTHIHIRDYGIGIPTDMHDGLFSMDREKVRRGTGGEYGSGLGLWLIRDLLQKNNGHIFVNPHTEPGTEITVTLYQV